MSSETVYESANHNFYWLGRDETGLEEGVQTNQYLIVDNGRGTLLDPGGFGVFSRVVVNMSAYVDPDKIDHIFLCHQDPDVGGGLASWMDMTPARVHVSALWIRFLLHYGVTAMDRIDGIPDGGASLALSSGNRLEFIPAHFLHSPGNFHAFDHASGILFTGDIGAAIYSKGETPLFVEDFEEHVEHMELFHTRYVATSKAIEVWLSKIRNLPIRMICPQHGSIFRENEARKFLEWIGRAKVGFDSGIFG
jgi:flavorubredoxin